MGRIYLVIGDYAMRDIEREDLAKLLAWRNSPEIHSKMLTDHVITWEEHVKWFDASCNKQPRLNFVFTYRGKLAGYLGFTDYDMARGTCSPGSYLGPELNLPVDAGVILQEMVGVYARETLSAKQIITPVFMDNKRVLKLHMLNGGRLGDTFTVEKDGKKRECVNILYDL